MHSIAFRATKVEGLDLPETIDVIRTVDIKTEVMLYRVVNRRFLGNDNSDHVGQVRKCGHNLYKEKVR